MLKLLGNTVLVKENKEPVTSPLGIILPGTDTKYPNESEVVAVGQGRILNSGTVVPVEVSVGDKVIYSKHSDGQTVSVDGQDYLILDGASILAIRN